jgi:8-oxo-dGTP diphosphatase
MKSPKPLRGFNKYIRRNRTHDIQEIIRETTAGGIIYRINDETKQLQFLMVQDARDRWTIPKGHVEKGENTKQTALREIIEETGLQDIEIKSWLGKNNFRFRRQNSLVLMVTHIYLAEARSKTDNLIMEDWMNGIKWFPAEEAVKKIAYENVSILMELAIKRIKNAEPR